MNPAEVIRTCAETSSKQEKVGILKNNDSNFLRYVLENALSPYIVLGIKQVEYAEPLGHVNFEDNLKFLKFCIHHLLLRDIRGKVKDFIFECSKSLNEDQQYVLKCIIDKDLDAGIGIKTANKAFPGLIKEFSVQLAAKIDFDKVAYPCYAEVKRDGRRNVVVIVDGKVRHFSRNGKENNNYHYFDDQILELAAGQDLVFDGEVSGIVSGDNRKERRLSQQQANRKTAVDMSQQAFTIWDCMPLGLWKNKKCNHPYYMRHGILQNLFGVFHENASTEVFKIRFSRNKKIDSQEDLNVYYYKILKKGCEGIVVKHREGMYEFKRSITWMKMKQEHTGDYKITDVLEGKKSRKGTLGSIVVDVEGVAVRCGLGRGITIDDCKALWKRRKKLIGTTAEVTHGGVTLDGSLVVPKFIKLRDDK